MSANDTEVISQSAVSVDVVDTTGAGDTFVGFLLAAMVTGAAPADALRRAVRASALAVTVAGATPSIPTAAMVDSMAREMTAS